MPLTLDASVGGSASNSYITLAAAETYFESRLDITVWDAATDDDKNRALYTATRLLDSMYVWANVAVDATQRLHWPRVFMLDAKRRDTIASTVIPEELGFAAAELANTLLVSDRTLDSDIETQGLTKLVAGSVELEFKDEVFAKIISDLVVNFIPTHWGYLTGQGGFGSVELQRA